MTQPHGASPEGGSTGLERTQDQLEIALREGDESSSVAQIAPASKSADLDAEPSAVWRALEVWHRAMETGRSEPLFIARDHAIRLMIKEAIEQAFTGLRAGDHVRLKDCGPEYAGTVLGLNGRLAWLRFDSGQYTTAEQRSLIRTPATAREHSSPRQVLQPIRDEPLLSKGGGESPR